MIIEKITENIIEKITKKIISLLINKFTYLFLFAFLVAACDPNLVYEQNIELNNLTWHKDSIITINANVEDTISPHNIYVNIRNTSKYEKQNLFLFITTTSPNGTVLKDTLECYLADKRGKWTGSGWGDLFDNQFLYKKNIRFPISGTYKFEYVQGMRVNELKHISDIGLRIEKVESK